MKEETMSMGGSSVKTRRLDALVLLVVTSLAATACMAEVGAGEDEELQVTQEAILNGTVPAEWGRGVVALISEFPGRGVLRCSGTFINRFDVLTAAHCVRTDDGVRASRVDVVMGANWNGTRHRADRFVDHPSWRWSPMVENDVALVSFSSPLAPIGAAMPVAAFSMPAGTHVGWQVVTAGFGASKTDGTGAGTKRWAYARIRENNGRELTLAGVNNTGICHGDSGGPVAGWDGNKWVVVGVISGSSSTRCSPTDIDFAAMPTRQRAFIDANVSIRGQVN